MVVDQSRDDHDVGAGQPRGHERAAVDLGKGNLAADQRRHGLWPATDVNQFGGYTLAREVAAILSHPSRQ